MLFSFCRLSLINEGFLVGLFLIYHLEDYWSGRRVMIVATNSYIFSIMFATKISIFVNVYVDHNAWQYYEPS